MIENQKGPTCSPRGEAGRQAGQALLEALLALAFAVVIITAVVIAVITTLNNSSFTKNQNLASQYAQEGLDIARNMRDSKYDEFKALPSAQFYCAENGTLSEGEFCSAGDFIRQIYIDHGVGGVGGRDENGNQRCEVGSSFVSSIVLWADSKCSEENPCHRMQLDSCFSNPNRPFGS